ncbi:MBL fold metallo-hydrolase [Paenibacillus sp. PL2-23]|uniref:MBL fold metallo-hydrolase n=1 Tax=Paenibacillus sp. PL2-23 TaxID=2100729 RepID=UPI0030F91539
MGVPRVYCSCEVCLEARNGEGRNKRLRSSLQVDMADGGVTWIDCGPDWGRQMEAANLRSIDRMLITHAHFDHIGGLPEWYDACRWSDVRGIAYSPTEVIAEINARFPWLSSRIELRSLDEPIVIGQWRVRSWRVNHGKNGYAYAFRFQHERSGYTWVYCSDAIDLTEEQQEPLRGVDLLILGTSFFHEPYPRETRSLYDVREAMELFRLWQPKEVILTHLSHDIHIDHRDALPANVRYAETGMRVELQL